MSKYIGLLIFFFKKDGYSSLWQKRKKIIHRLNPIGF